MSNTRIIIEERSRDIGDFLVGRLIPFRKKRMVGPFCFIDHMGPSQIGPKTFMDVGQHPHIGLSTLTYLFEGEIVHRDSTGAVKTIKPGNVGWMTAGKGVVHTERTPKEMRDGNIYPVHGFQIWVALPKDKEDIQPEFSHTEKSELPSWSEKGVEYTLIAGQGYGKKSPVPVYSDLFMIQLISKEKSTISVKGNLKGEIGICVVEGYIEACNDSIENGNMLISKVNDACSFTMGENTRLLLFGGAPFEEERHIEWNFVSSRRDTIEKAKKDWINKDFKMVQGETDYIPLPDSTLQSKKS
ncbi:pirin family protein [Aquimarina pacifica]|uniref:pirin family protein n=1 Tax=Aquimarina pacifica TaxID=1296415 RepID=UPI0004726A30|nr:pirin family protein [Aquimarina pacifica]